MTRRRLVPLEVKGIALLLVLASLVWLSVAFYDKTFVSTVDVTLHVDRAGLQLPIGGDVRMRGALVGRISGIDRTEGTVDIHLALVPKDADQVPTDAVGRILPTTLFGQKYVELVDSPSEASELSVPHVADGAVLKEDTSHEAVEITDVLDRLEPLLTAVHPEDLSMTLQAVSNGLHGRGNQLGEFAASTRQYLAEVRPELPTLVRDLQLLSTVSHVYGDATPDILRLLQNVTVTGSTVVDDKAKLQTFIDEATTFADRTRAFLDRNGDGIADLDRATRPVLELLGRYSLEFPCLVKGLIRANTVAGRAFYHGIFHAELVVGKQYPAYTAADEPKFGDIGSGPSCAGLPTPTAPVPAVHSDDGADYPPGSILPPLQGIP